MLEVFDLAKKRTAILENAFNVSETVKLNAVSQLSFELPITDEKTTFCQPRHYVRYDEGQLYRIIDRTAVDNAAGVMQYQCEHVIATLVDKVLFKDHILDNQTTAQAINYILARQSDWELSACDFSYRYSYLWSSENLLAALFSIATPFTDYYKWEYNTTVYPWRLSLKRIDTTQKPQFYVFKGLNFLESQKKEMQSEIVTRLYCLGYGEGVNQLGIESVNGGRPYIDAPTIGQYGTIESIFTDRRYEDAAALKAAGLAMLEKLQEPRVQYTVAAADLDGINGSEYMRADVGKVIMFAEDSYKTFITETAKNYDNVGDMTITVANTPEDIASSIADIADRQRIESVYAQGATQIYAQSIQANASSTKGTILRFFIPEEMRVINFVKAKITLEGFRAYSSATENSEESLETSEDGGGTTATGQASRKTSTDQIEADIGLYKLTIANIDSGSWWNALHNETPYHQHVYQDFTMSKHSHGMEHTHGDITIPDHKHKFNIPPHKHDITAGIYEFGNPSTATIFVNGVSKGTMGTDGDMDITDFLLDARNEVPRGSWQTIEIRPNDLAYITIDLIIQGFVQSRGGGTH